MHVLDSTDGGATVTYLLHDARLSLRKGDVATRLILNELDLDLAPLATRLVLVVLILIAGGALSWPLGAAGVDGTVATRHELVLDGRRVFVGDGGDVGHVEGEKGRQKVVEVVRRELYRCRMPKGE